MKNKDTLARNGGAKGEEGKLQFRFLGTQLTAPCRMRERGFGFGFPQSHSPSYKSSSHGDKASYSSPSRNNQSLQIRCPKSKCYEDLT